LRGRGCYRRTDRLWRVDRMSGAGNTKAQPERKRVKHALCGGNIGEAEEEVYNGRAGAELVLERRPHVEGIVLVFTQRAGAYVWLERLGGALDWCMADEAKARAELVAGEQICREVKTDECLQLDDEADRKRRQAGG
jgi:hypothetical protein